MFDDLSICPYPGLRPFTEDESLYFKGRDSHIGEITKLLQEKKFLMVTGASGDGKSSVIFGGLIPNARAGFFKSKYNNWSVAHFRPERSPVRNFAKVLAPLMGDHGVDTVETEVRRGFGSLIDLYRSSGLFLDESSNEWKRATEEERDELKRGANNLLIVVDQFEEFFTNPENFHKGAPTQDAQILVNLLLETSRISLKDDLPIYVVFTMRSDFIGQCAAFRGLPEFIGFSQFFVPRLKRKELQQVIEEPAELNGNKISRRLVERLLYDLSEGIDQLPILQHALNQIWHKASMGQEEMDLIHYAMVGGMAAEELPEEDQRKFEEWFQELADYKKEHFENPGLTRVLDIHANDLYEGAWQYYYDNGGDKEISKRDAKNIIAMTFACLTKIDDSRAVRNLMSLEDITQILNRPHLDVKTVGKVISYYREQGNTFIRPFIEEDRPDSKELSAETGLDITHESLIRNWERLKRWANKEFEYYETYLDFKKQLDKWLESGRSRGYLLPIGPLTYFESWYKECRPNKYWISRYAGEREDDEGLLKESATILTDARSFLKKSARKVAITRAYMKHGTARVAALLAILLVGSLSGFYYYDAGLKQNASVLSKLVNDADILLSDLEIGPFQKADYLVSLERIEDGGYISHVSSIDTLEVRLDVSNWAYYLLLNMDQHFKAPFKSTLLAYIDSELDGRDILIEPKLEQTVFFIDQLAYDYYFNSSEEVRGYMDKQLERIPPALEEIAMAGEFDNSQIFNWGIESVLNWGGGEAEFQRLLNLISPFEGARSTFDALYPIGESQNNGWNWGIAHNGGYQELAYLYAALGDVRMAIQCTDSVLRYDASYWHVRTYNNGYNVLSYMLKFGHTDAASKYLDYLVKKSELERSDLLDRVLNRTGGLKYSYSYRVFGQSFTGSDPNYNPNISLLEWEGIEWLFQQYEESIQAINNPDDRNYRLALLYKMQGIYLDKYSQDRGTTAAPETLNQLFGRALQAYEKVGADFLGDTRRAIYKYYGTGIRTSIQPRWYYFVYPDHFSSTWYNDRYESPSFLEFVLDGPGLDALYTNVEELETLNDWLAAYYQVYPDLDQTNNRRNSIPMESDFLAKLLEKVSQHPDFEEFDATFLNLLLANIRFEEDDPVAESYLEQIDISKLQLVAGRWEYLELTFVNNEILKLARAMIETERVHTALALIETLPDNNYRAVAYSVMAEYAYDGEDKKLAFQFLDSAFSNGRRVDVTLIPVPLDYRNFLARALTGIGGKPFNDIAWDMYTDMIPNFKDLGLFYNIWGIALEGNYYQASERIPDDIPRFWKLGYTTIILNEEAYRRPARDGWETFADYYNWLYREYIVFSANF